MTFFARSALSVVEVWNLRRSAQHRMSATSGEEVTIAVDFTKFPFQGLRFALQSPQQKRTHCWHAWTLLDNFEWADGYSQRYGFTYVDIRNRRRTLRNSELRYAKVARANRLDL